MAVRTEEDGPWTIGRRLPMVVWIRVPMPIARKQVLIMTGTTVSGRPARETNMPAQMKGVKSTRVICQAKKRVCHQLLGFSSTPMDTLTVLSGCVSKMGCSGLYISRLPFLKLEKGRRE